MKDTTFPVLLQALFEVLDAHRPAFRQGRTFLRAVGLLISEVFT